MSSQIDKVDLFGVNLLVGRINFMDAILYPNFLMSLKSFDIVYCEFIEGKSEVFGNNTHPGNDYRKFNPPSEYSYVFINAMVTVAYDGQNMRLCSSSGLPILVPKMSSVVLPCACVRIVDPAGYNNPTLLNCNINFDNKYFSYIESDFHSASDSRTYLWPGIQFIYFA